MALVDSIANKALKRPLLGIAVAVAADDRIVFDRGYGYADLGRSTPVGSQTVFHVGSISKNIAAATLLQLADQGKLSLDEDITRSIPNAPVHGKHITVLQLLNHTSGIPSFTSLPDTDQNETKDLSHDQVLDLLKDVPPGFDPGTSWRYNNTGFYLAGMVVENVTHSAYGAYLHDRIFTPLEMRSSSLCDASTPVPNLAAGSEVADGKLTAAKPMTWKVPFAAGGVCATASDLLRWQIALNKNHIVSKRSLALMRTPTVLADGTSIDYGLGTRIGLLDGHKVFGQTGSGGGYTAVLETFPDDHVSIAVLINTDRKVRRPIWPDRLRARCWARRIFHYAIWPYLLKSCPAFLGCTNRTRAPCACWRPTARSTLSLRAALGSRARSRGKANTATPLMKIGAYDSAARPAVPAGLWSIREV